MNDSLNPTPLQLLMHKKGWRLVKVKQELIRKKMAVSWPTLVMIKNGFRSVKGKKVAYKPDEYTLIKLGRLFKRKPETMYEDRSQE